MTERDTPAIELDPTTKRDALVGRTLSGKFRLGAVLGEGGMGTVYRARHLALEKTIAVKVMHQELASDPILPARFEREAKAAHRLDHPNSIRILDFGREPDGLLYIAMEFLDGRQLLSILDAEAPLAPARTVDLLSQVLSALAVAHEMGVIHRDLKPENIMVLQKKQDDGREGEVVKVCDFGIAKLADPPDSEELAGRPKHRKLTTAGLVIGTPEYMSPEQGRGEALDARSDLYSVGAILYFMLSGRTPFDGPTPIDIVVRHQKEEPVPPSVIRPGADVRLEAVCLKALKKRPDDRYVSAREMRAALLSAIGRAAPPGPSKTLAGLATGSDARARAAALHASSVPTLPFPANDLGRPAAASASPSARWRKRALGAWMLVVLGCAWVGGSRYSRHSLASRESAASGVTLRAPEPPASPPSADVTPDPAPAPSPTDALAVAPTASAPPARRRRIAPRPPPGVLAAAQPVVHDTQGPAIESQPVPPAEPLEPPPLPAVPVIQRFDPSAAHVEPDMATDLGGGVRPSDVNRVVRGATDRMSACYRASATASFPEGEWTLRLATDDTGHVDEARLDGPLPDAVKRCISNSLRGTTIPVDTGAGSAKVRLTFSLR